MLDKITLHWSGGPYTPSKDDFRAYNFCIDGEGKVHLGDHKPEHNISTKDGEYAAHAGQFNTGNIGIGICSMGKAKESPFSKGKWPIKQNQIESAVELCVQLCKTYSIDVENVFVHSEVLPRFGKGVYKWDINYVPELGERLVAPSVSGAYFRDKIKEAQGDTQQELPLEENNKCCCCRCKCPQ